MSTEQDKIKNSKRRQKDENAVKKQSKIAKQHSRLSDYKSKAELEPHRFIKHHAMDCGNPECFICGNPRKTHKDKLTQQEKRIYQDIDTPNDKRSNGIRVKDVDE